ncbi:MAG: 50S ribosomal protein L5 [Candidatus Bathyarchaeia archaeon]
MSEEKTELSAGNPCRSMRVEKVVVNIGVGASGERLEKAKAILKRLTGANPCERRALDTVREFNVRKNEPIAAMVTLRGNAAGDFLKLAFQAVGNRLKASSFSGRTFSFGIKEHISMPGVKYDPSIGIFGMDICVTLERPGYRVSRRRRRTSKVGGRHVINTHEAIDFMRENFGIEVT